MWLFLIEIVLLVVIAALMYYVLVPALLDALCYLAVAIIYMLIVAAAFTITACVVLAIYCEPNPSSVGDLAGETLHCFRSAYFWMWNRSK